MLSQQCCLPERVHVFFTNRKPTLSRIQLVPGEDTRHSVPTSLVPLSAHLPALKARYRLDNFSSLGSNASDWLFVNSTI